MWYTVHCKALLTKEVNHSPGLVINPGTLANFAEELSMVDLCFTIIDQNAELAFILFYEKFIGVFQCTIPVYKTKQPKSAINSWVTSDLMSKIEE